MNIPAFETIAGVTFPAHDMGGGAVQICIDSANFDECKAYEKKLAGCGFTKHICREIAGGSERAHNKNLFYLYKKEDMQIALTFAAALRKTQIIASPSAPLYAQNGIWEQKAVPSITQCTGTGMGYVVQLADGTFILIDGGVYTEEDAETLYTILQDKAPQGEKPTVSMWFFTHPDIDHIGLATTFLYTHKEHVDIRGFGYSFSPYEAYAAVDTLKIRENVRAFEESIRTNFPGAATYYLYMGDVFSFPGAEAEILWTGDMLYPAPLWTGNDQNAAIRFRFEGGKTAVFLGDLMHSACQQLALTYGDGLKCDVLQITHHGLIGGDIGTYRLLDPAICFWPVAEARFHGTFSRDTFHWCVGEGGCDYNRFIRDDSIRRRIHLHQGKVETVFMHKSILGSVPYEKSEK